MKTDPSLVFYVIRTVRLIRCKRYTQCDVETARCIQVDVDITFKFRDVECAVEIVDNNQDD